MAMDNIKIVKYMYGTVGNIYNSLTRIAFSRGLSIPLVAISLVCGDYYYHDN